MKIEFSVSLTSSMICSVLTMMSSTEFVMWQRQCTFISLVGQEGTRDFASSTAWMSLFPGIGSSAVCVREEVENDLVSQSS
jgi:hypothetical protein